MSEATPKAASKAWNEWHDFRALDQFYNRPSPMFLHAFAAGQVAALEDAADDMGKQLDTFAARGANTRARWAEKWLRARAAELSKEQHDQPDA